MEEQAKLQKVTYDQQRVKGGERICAKVVIINTFLQTVMELGSIPKSLWLLIFM